MKAPDKIYIQQDMINNLILEKQDFDDDVVYIRKDALLEKLSRAKELRLKNGAKESSDGIQVIDSLIKMIKEM